MGRALLGGRFRIVFLLAVGEFVLGEGFDGSLPGGEVLGVGLGEEALGFPDE